MIVDFGNYCPSLEKKKSLLSRRTPIRKNESKFKQIQLPHSKVIAVIQRIISENGRWFIDQKGNGERRSGRGASRRSSTHFPQSHNDDDWADCLSPRIDRVIEVSGDEGLKTLTNFKSCHFNLLYAYLKPILSLLTAGRARKTKEKPKIVSLFPCDTEASETTTSGSEFVLFCRGLLTHDILSLVGSLLFLKLLVLFGSGLISWSIFECHSG